MKDKENLDKQKREKEEVPGKGEFTETTLITHKGFSQYTLKQERKREELSRRESGKKEYGEVEKKLEESEMWRPIPRNRLYVVLNNVFEK